MDRGTHGINKVFDRNGNISPEGLRGMTYYLGLAKEAAKKPREDQLGLL